MFMKTTRISFALISVTAVIGLAGCSKTPPTEDKDLMLKAFEERPQLCLYKQGWPVYAGEDDKAFAKNYPDAPAGKAMALEAAGLAKGVPHEKVTGKLYGGTFTVKSTRYTLSADAISKFFKVTDRPVSDDGESVPQGRLCVATRKVRQIVATRPLGKLNGDDAVEVTYRYAVSAREPFTLQAGFVKAFPEFGTMVDQAGTVDCKAIMKVKGEELVLVPSPATFSKCVADL